MQVFRKFVLLAVLAGLATPAICGDSKTIYYAVFIDGKKIGHSISTKLEADGKVTTSQEMLLELGRGNVKMKVAQKTTSVETADGKPLEFTSTQDMGIMATTSSGAIKDGKLTLTKKVGGKSTTTQTDWPKDAVMTHGGILIAKAKGLKEGTEYSYNYFMPDSAQTVELKVKVGPEKEVDLLGRIVRLVEIATTMSMPGGAMTATIYCDKDYADQKVIMTLAGMKLELVACSRQFALSDNDVVDFLARSLIEVPDVPADLRKARSAKFHLTMSKDDLKLPQSDAQKVEKSGKTLVVTVRPSTMPSGGTFPYKGSDKELLAATRPAAYLQSDQKEIIDLAKKAVGDTTDAGEAAGKMEKFVAGYIKKKDFSVGYASALEVARTPQGDCTEHAVLLAAMCRSLGIPARVASGMAYMEQFAGKKNIMGMHAWTQVNIDGSWLDLDAALGFDAGHVLFATDDGDNEDFMSLVAILGNFKIEKVEVEN